MSPGKDLICSDTLSGASLKEETPEISETGNKLPSSLSYI